MLSEVAPVKEEEARALLGCHGAAERVTVAMTM